MIQNENLFAKSASTEPRTSPDKVVVRLGPRALLWDRFCPGCRSGRSFLDRKHRYFERRPEPARFPIDFLRFVFLDGLRNNIQQLEISGKLRKQHVESTICRFWWFGGNFEIWRRRSPAQIPNTWKLKCEPLRAQKYYQDPEITSARVTVCEDLTDSSVCRDLDTCAVLLGVIDPDESRVVKMEE